jgi:hypothetical protein
MLPLLILLNVSTEQIRAGRRYACASLRSPASVMHEPGLQQTLTGDCEAGCAITGCPSRHLGYGTDSGLLLIPSDFSLLTVFTPAPSSSALLAVISNARIHAHAFLRLCTCFPCFCTMLRLHRQRTRLIEFALSPARYIALLPSAPGQPTSRHAGLSLSGSPPA